MLLCVPERLVWHKAQQPQGKTHHPNVSQSRLSLNAAQGLYETSERIWSILWWGDGISSISPRPSLPWGCCGRVIYGDVIEEEDHDFSSLCQIAIKIRQWVEKGNVNKKRMKHLSRDGMEGIPSGHFVPSVAADWKTYSWPLTVRCI